MTSAKFFCQLQTSIIPEDRSTEGNFDLCPRIVGPVRILAFSRSIYLRPTCFSLLESADTSQLVAGILNSTDTIRGNSDMTFTHRREKRVEKRLKLADIHYKGVMSSTHSQRQKCVILTTEIG